VTQEVADAAAQGDRSENAEYIYGKRRLREIDRRVRFLSKRLDAVTVVREAPSDESRVFFGAWVTLEDDDGVEVTYRIVGPDESNVELGWISMDAPVAIALLGKRDGQDVTVTRPKGNITYTIVGVRY
jgi:transcription elongation factor GreB